MPDDPIQTGFVLYAGPWAEVRRFWPKQPESLDDAVDGVSFGDMITRAFETASDFNGESDRARYIEVEKHHSGTWKNEADWSDELERHGR